MSFRPWQHRAMEPSSLDLASLEVLRQLLATRSVTETARRTGSTQPSVSRVLARLRERLGDPLLVRVGRTLEPTARGRELEPRVREALEALARVLAPITAFDPSREEGVVVLAASDYAIAAFLEPALVSLRALAPGLTMRVTVATSATVGELVRGEVQLVVGPRAPVDGIDALVLKPLAIDRFVCALRRGHPASKRPLTLARYLALDHVAVGNDRPGPSSVQLALQKLDRVRRVPLVLPSFLAAAHLVASTDLVATLPARLVERVPGLVARPLPFALAPLELHLGWHPRSTSEPRHRWLRETLLAAAGTGARRARRAS